LVVRCQSGKRPQSRIGGAATTIWAGSLPVLSSFSVLVGLFSSAVLGVLILAFGELLQNVKAIRQSLESTGRAEQTD
jgi:hypothetical protein